MNSQILYDYATNRTPKIKKGTGKDEWAYIL